MPQGVPFTSWQSSLMFIIPFRCRTKNECFHFKMAFVQSVPLSPLCTVAFTKSPSVVLKIREGFPNHISSKAFSYRRPVPVSVTSSSSSSSAEKEKAPSSKETVSSVPNRSGDVFEQKIPLSSEDLSFAQAMNIAQKLLSNLNQAWTRREHHRNDHDAFGGEDWTGIRDQTTDKIAFLLHTRNGARGFFVVWATADATIIDQPEVRDWVIATALVRALHNDNIDGRPNQNAQGLGDSKSAPHHIVDLMLLNLIMASTAAAAHQANRNMEAWKSSQVVIQRTRGWILQASSQYHQFQSSLVEMKNMLLEFDSAYEDQDTLKNENASSSWAFIKNYTEEQKQAALFHINQVLDRI